MKKVLAVAMLAVLPLHAAEEPITLKKIKYDELKAIVAGHKGKVVVVDFWNVYCPPCMKGIQHVVQLKNRIKDPDFIAITVDLDPPDDKEDIPAAKKFLTDKKITLINYLLDEKKEVWVEKLNLTSFPRVYVFNRAGQIERQFKEEPKPAEFDPLIEKLLKEKAP